MLLRRAKEKAEASGDDYNLTRFNGIKHSGKSKFLTTGDRNDLNMYLFGDTEGRPAEILLRKPETKPQTPKVKKQRLTPQIDLGKAVENYDRPTIIKAYGGIDSQSPALKGLTPEERRQLNISGLIRTKARGGVPADDLLHSLKNVFPGYFDEYGDESDLLTAILNKSIYKNIDPDKIEQEAKEYYARLEEDAAREGIDSEALAGIIEEDKASELAERNALGSEETDLGWELTGGQAKKSALEQQLDDLQEAFPNVDRAKAAQVLKALPYADHPQVAAMVGDPDLFSRVAKGNLSATERTQLLNKANDIAEQKTFPGMGGGGLFDTDFRSAPTKVEIKKIAKTSTPTDEIAMKFGEHIGGSKFDRAHGILTAEDLKGMTDREAQALVKKENIWRKPDYAAMVEEGAQPHIAWLVKTMRDALPTAPTRPNLREIFIDEVGRVRDILSKLKTEDELKDLFATVFGPSLYEKTGMRGMGWTDEGREVAKALGNKFIKALQVSSWDITKAKRTVAEKEWPFAKGTGGGGERQKMPERPLLENIKRTGEDYRGGKNITPAEFQETFGFRGGEFGKWLNQADRQDSLNYAYDAFMDLANILGVPPKAISLEGELGFAFGARGSGRHAAHYEPAKIVINLTKTKGAGATAHEWAHALDDYFGRLSGKTKLGTYASHGMTPVPFSTGGQLPGVREEMRQAWKNVSDAMTYRYETYNEAVKSAADQLAQSVKYTESWLGGIRRGLTEENKTRLDALTPKILEGDTRALNESFTFSKPDKSTRQGLITNFDFSEAADAAGGRLGRGQRGL